jgi:hypothetical protein
MSPENWGVFRLLKEVTLHLLSHSSLASFCGNVARRSSAFAGAYEFCSGMSEI